MNYFFEEIITIEDISDKINTYSEDEKDREYLKEVVKSVIHHKVVDNILVDLSDDDKVYILEMLSLNHDNKTTLDALKEKVSELEAKIVSAVSEAKTELHELLQ